MKRCFEINLVKLNKKNRFEMFKMCANKAMGKLGVDMKVFVLGARKNYKLHFSCFMFFLTVGIGSRSVPLFQKGRIRSQRV